MDSKMVTMIIIGGSALVYGIYYKYFGKTDALSALKAEYIERKCCLNKSLALKLMIYGVKAGEERYLKNKPQLDDSRRKAINYKDSYYELCQETLNTRQDYFDEEFLELLNKFNAKFTMNELQEISGGLPPIQLSHIIYQYEIPNFQGTIPSLQLAKEIYIYYANYIIDALKETKIDRNNNNIFAQREIYFKFYFLYLKINDIIYEKYNHLNDQIVKYVLFKDQAFEKDEEIQKLKKAIEIFDKILLTY